MFPVTIDRINTNVSNSHPPRNTSELIEKSMCLPWVRSVDGQERGNMIKFHFKMLGFMLLMFARVEGSFNSDKYHEVNPCFNTTVQPETVQTTKVDSQLNCAILCLEAVQCHSFSVSKVLPGACTLNGYLLDDDGCVDWQMDHYNVQTVNNISISVFYYHHQHPCVLVVLSCCDAIPLVNCCFKYYKVLFINICVLISRSLKKTVVWYWIPRIDFLCKIYSFFY